MVPSEFDLSKDKPATDSLHSLKRAFIHRKQVIIHIPVHIFTCETSCYVL